MTRASLREYAAVQRERYQKRDPRPRSTGCWTRSWPSPACIAKPPSGCCGALPRARAPPGPGGRPRRYGAEVGRCGRGPVGGHWPHRRPSPPALRGGGPRPAPPVRRADLGAGHRQARAAGQSPHARAAPQPRRGRQFPPRGAHHHAGRDLARSTKSPFAPSPSGTDARPGFLRGRSRRSLREQYRGLLPLYTLRGGHRHGVDRARSRLGQGPGARGRRRSIGCARACPCPCSAWTVTTAPSSSTTHLYDVLSAQRQITFTRSRAWKKNDSAHVEQKNGAVVRQPRRL